MATEEKKGVSNDGTNYVSICANCALRFQDLCHSLPSLFMRSVWGGGEFISINDVILLFRYTKCINCNQNDIFRKLTNPIKKYQRNHKWSSELMTITNAKCYIVQKNSTTINILWTVVF